MCQKSLKTRDKLKLTSFTDCRQKSGIMLHAIKLIDRRHYSCFNNAYRRVI